MMMFEWLLACMLEKYSSNARMLFACCCSLHLDAALPDE